MSNRVLRCIQAAFDLDPEEVSTSIRQEHVEGWDSIGTLGLILCLEEEFGVSIAPETARLMTGFPEIVVQLRLLGIDPD